MTNYHLSKKYNLCSSYFHQMELNNKIKYDYIFSFDKDKNKSILKYFDYVEELVSKMQDILNFFDGPEYGEFLYKNKIVNHINFFELYTKECKVIFQYRDKSDFFSFTFYQLEKYKKIIDIFNKHKKIIS